MEVPLPHRRPSQGQDSGQGQVEGFVQDTMHSNSHLPVRTVVDSQSEMTELILPNDANTLGNLLGGRLMHFIDLVAAMAAYRHARTHVVTAAMDHIDFIAPVHVGDLLILKSSLNRAFNTSMEVGVKVWVENTVAGIHRHVASAYLTFVAVDIQGRRVPVPKLQPETEEEQRHYEDAGRRRELRQRELERKRAKGPADPVLAGTVRPGKI
jgi:acyl-CoA hydrolase